MSHCPRPKWDGLDPLQYYVHAVELLNNRGITLYKVVASLVKRRLKRKVDLQVGNTNHGSKMEDQQQTIFSR